jgi:hypothetical protein
MTTTLSTREREVLDRYTDTQPTQPVPTVAEKPEKPAPVLVKDDGTPTSVGWRKIGERLRAPMDDVKQRPGRGTQKFDYVTARQVADRLDDVVNPGNWETRFCVLDPGKQVVECTITIFGQHKSDVGYPNNPSRPELEEEPFKAAYSDAFKRAAVQWGVGRWLYDDL